jgi:Flp pilus assembly protein TadG
MRLRRRLLRLRADHRGGTLIEFGILAPAVFAMMFGIMQIGLQMQNYNALRSVASDVARYTVVEYQKNDKISATLIEDKALAIAVGPAYLLNPDRITVNVTTPTSEITGATKFDVALTYVPPNFLKLIGMGDLTLNYNRPIYVPT